MDRHEADLAERDQRTRAPLHGARPRLERPVRATVFDLDGTLLDTEHLYRAAFYAAMAELGWSLPNASYEGLIGLPSTARRSLISRLLGPAFPADDFFTAYYRHRSAALSCGILLKPGVEQALDLLDASGLPYAVATSASARTARANLASANLLHRFPILVTRDEVDRGKPCPDSFIEAACRLGEAPENCLAIEDSHAGVTAAYQAGMMIVTVPDAVPPNPEMLRCCVAVLGSLHELGALLGLPSGGTCRRTQSFAAACVTSHAIAPERPAGRGHEAGDIRANR